MGSGKRKEDPPSERHRCARVEMFSNHSKDRGSNMQVTMYGVDLAKRVFQVHWVEAQTGEVKRKMLLRQEVSEFFSRRCASSPFPAEATSALPPTNLRR
jgi:hypothetical protein